jgi:hypothetical protein
MARGSNFRSGQTSWPGAKEVGRGLPLAVKLPFPPVKPVGDGNKEG